MANSADPDQLASDLDLHCLQRQAISGFSMTRVKKKYQYCFFFCCFFFFFFFEKKMSYLEL